VAARLSIAPAPPLVYPPHEREGREILDASLASYTPIWLATGQAEDLPIVVLRSARRRRIGERRKAPGAARLPAWVNEIMSGAVASRDTFLLERLPRVNVFDIPLPMSPFNFALRQDESLELIRAGRWAVADDLGRRQEPIVPTAKPDDDRAEGRAGELYGAHLDRLASGRTATVFLSYAREDRPWVERLRSQLGELLAD